jgi:hypothetical protein
MFVWYDLAHFGIADTPPHGPLFEVLSGILLRFPCLLGGVAAAVLGRGGAHFWFEGVPTRFFKGLVAGFVLGLVYCCMTEAPCRLWFLLSTEQYHRMMWHNVPVAMSAAGGLYLVLFVWASNLNESPKAAKQRLITPAESRTWWEARRLQYNVGLLVAGAVAFLCYVVVWFTLVPWVFEASKISFPLFTAVFQGIGYLLMMGVANLCYFLGPLSERVFQPSDAARFRRVCYRLGFWFSVLLPLALPAMLIFRVLFFPRFGSIIGL